MNQGYYSRLDVLWTVFSRVPNATAYVRGSKKYPDIRGVVQFYEYQNNVLAVAEMMGLPTSKEICRKGIYAFHIHEGDLPPLFENEGYALSVFLTNRFKIEDILGKTVIVQSDTDDFHTQPSGNAGEKIACGEIIPIKMMI